MWKSKTTSPRMTLLVTLVAGMGLACNDGGKDTGGGGKVTVTDKDKDGFPASVDCRDDAETIFPGATERCDGIDNDCDGVIDGNNAEDAIEFYADFDEDGFGVFAYTTPACRGTVVEGFIEPEEDSEPRWDCDDFNPDINPEATEVCNGIDDDCDDTIDGAYAEGQNTYYRDLDGDGYGDPDVVVLACSGLDIGYVTNSEDCDDSEATTYIGAPDLCDDDIDNDCSGLINESCPYEIDDSDEIDFVIWNPTDNELFGNHVAAGGDLNGDGFADLVVGAPGDDDPGGEDWSNAGQVSVFYGPLTVPGEPVDPPSNQPPVPWMSSADADATVIPTSDFDDMGYTLWLGRDVDDNGMDDLLIGAYDGGPTSDGAAYLYYGPVTGVVEDTDADARFVGDPAEDSPQFARWLTAIPGDVDEDGIDDIAIGDDYFGSALGSDDYVGTGRIYLFSGTLTGTVPTSAAFATITGTTTLKDGETVDSDVRDRVGYSLAVSRPDRPKTDMNGDGYFDAVVGVSGEQQTWIIYGPLSGALGEADADVVLVGNEDDRFGSSLAVGDVNNDGHMDLAVGDPNATRNGQGGSGAVFVFNGPVTTSLDINDTDVPFADFETWETDSSYYLGDHESSLVLEDLDGDGNDDLFAGVPDNSDVRYHAGAAYLFFGPLSGAGSVAELADRTIAGRYESDSIGIGLEIADIDGNGLNDLLVGADGYKVSHGAVGVFLDARLY